MEAESSRSRSPLLLEALGCREVEWPSCEPVISRASRSRRAEISCSTSLNLEVGRYLHLSTTWRTEHRQKKGPRNRHTLASNSLRRTSLKFAAQQKISRSEKSWHGDGLTHNAKSHQVKRLVDRSRTKWRCQRMGATLVFEDR